MRYIFCTSRVGDECPQTPRSAPPLGRRNPNRFTILVYWLLIALLPFSAHADDTELYEPAPPPGSAFIRSIDAKPAHIGDYHVVKVEDTAVSAGKYYSRLAGKLREDAPLTNPAKARLYFYNLSDAKGAVIAPQHQNTVIVDDHTHSREVNALTLDLLVKAGDKPVQQFEKVTLRRREGISILLVGKQGKYQAVMKRNATAR